MIRGGGSMHPSNGAHQLPRTQRQQAESEKNRAEAEATVSALRSTVVQRLADGSWPQEEGGRRGWGDGELPRERGSCRETEQRS